MSVYKFSAINPDNQQRVKSELVANNLKEALVAIKKRGLNPIDVKVRRSLSDLSFGTSKVKQKDLILDSYPP